MRPAPLLARRGSLAGVVALCLWATAAGAVQFSTPQILEGGLSFVGAIAVGPEDLGTETRADGCVYATTALEGTVQRICYDADKQVLSSTQVVELNGGAGVEFLLGIAFDPASDPDGEIIMYLSWGHPNANPFNTRIARGVSTDGGNSYTVDELFVTGLGRSTVHSTNGIDIGPDGCLYLAKGNNSNAGYDPNYAESRLSGAILRMCFREPDGSVDPAFDRDCGNNNRQQACDVEVYASGFRNPFDLVWHSNGRLYATDNDMDIEDDPGCGGIANDFGCTCIPPVVDPGADELNLVEPGRYYGSPNPYLAMPSGLQCQGGADAGFACNDDTDCAGSGTCEDLSALCTDASCGDISQCFYFGLGEPPEPGEDPNGIYREPLVQPAGVRLDGIAEYRPEKGTVHRGGFCSDWNGDLLTGGATGNYDVRRFRLSNGGLAASHEGSGGLAGLTALGIDVAPDGTVFSADFPNFAVSYAIPIAQPDPALPDYFETCQAEVCACGAIPVPGLRGRGLGLLAVALSLGALLGVGWRHHGPEVQPWESSFRLRSWRRR